MISQKETGIVKLAVLALIIPLFVFAGGCGKSGNQQDQSTQKSTIAQKDAPTQKEADKKTEKFLIKMASPSTPEDSCVKAFIKFKEIVNSKSNGRIEVQVFHSGQLGAQRDYIEGLQMGSIQIAEINTSVLSLIHI